MGRQEAGRRLDQRSELGARLDSVADASVYCSLLVALAVFEGALFLHEWPWIVPAVLTYAISWTLSLLKFGTLPSYHTWIAKFSWYLVVVAAVVVVAFGDARPVRVVAVVVTVANLEAILITRKLDSPLTDVRSIAHP